MNKSIICIPMVQVNKCIFSVKSDCLICIAAWCECIFYVSIKVLAADVCFHLLILCRSTFQQLGETQNQQEAQRCKSIFQINNPIYGYQCRPFLYDFTLKWQCGGHRMVENSRKQFPNPRSQTYFSLQLRITQVEIKRIVSHR